MPTVLIINGYRANGMSTLANKSENILATKVWFSHDMFYVLLRDGREIGVPLLWFPRLRKASEEHLKDWRFIGIWYWNSLGEY
jgi:hypothetical protein